MTVFEWQSLLYPILLAQCIMAAAANFGIFWLVNRAATVLIATVVWLILAASFGVLTLVTGHSPILDIDQFRPAILWTRGALAVAMMFYIAAQVMRILKKA